MEPVFFPFTDVPGPVVAALGACFGRFVVYLPAAGPVPGNLQAAADRAELTVRIPVRDNGQRLARAIGAYRSWLREHQGQGWTYVKALGRGVPFFDDTAPSKIRSDIRQGAGASGSGDDLDPLDRARVFLQVAQDLDRQQADVQATLDGIDATQRALFESLQGAGDGLTVSARAASDAVDDPGGFMTSRRVSAWARLMLKDPDPSGVYVTTSQAVYDHVLADVPRAKTIDPVNPVPAPDSSDAACGQWRRQLMAGLSAALGDGSVGEPRAIAAGLPDLGAAAGSGSLTFCLVPGMGPRTFFAGLTDADDPGQPDTVRHTLIARLDP